MKKITVLSLFPQMIENALSYGIIKRASQSIEFSFLDLRTWGEGFHKKIDDPCTAHGVGMLLKADILYKAISDICKNNDHPYIIHVSPRGIPLTSKKAKELSGKNHLVIIASRYEGIDQRFIDESVHEEISIGDYVLSGGELASLVVIDAVLRMSGEVLQQEAVQHDSFEDGLLEHPHYTKPQIFNNRIIPEYLFSGNHALIDEKRFIEKLTVTWARRPDIFREYPICNVQAENKNLLTKLKKQNLILKKRLTSFEKAIQEYKDVHQHRNHIY
ncbi:MAG: tRNA (guanosine(37)-N1)-methyltransferase TrmD [Brevinemataceae bacterium]